MCILYMYNRKRAKKKERRDLDWLMNENVRMFWTINETMNVFCLEQSF